MSEAPRAPGPTIRGREKIVGEPPCYAALDLGTNNCRLLIATPSHNGGFRVIEAYSRIVRLGEGLGASGRLSDDAMERAMAALKVSGEKVRRRRVVKFRAIATQACRIADNGQAFVNRVANETGVKLQIISPQEEARLSVTGCLNLLDDRHEAALVVDVGGGSTELSWVDLKGGITAGVTPPVRAWLSVPIGVVTLAERFPEGDIATEGWFRQMVDHVKAEIFAFKRADPLRPLFAADRAHLVGTSGAITSLAGMHLQLPRYDRNRVDGIWMTRGECEAAADGLLALTAAQRAAQPCIGPDRADLVLAGAAILQAVQEEWPCNRVRVADRGLREGILLSLMAERSQRRRRKRRRGRGGTKVAA
ncbi:MAG: Ppx/GppA family phosphatase [Alphaproteobacteria bacterium]|nr:Ppx/GppA family phosphatase [Alphaproteobacteria bacterium]MBU1516495.1 Ppx/GppA family phosphatase [Alphaproteobacteria bacterium]MBU2094252.1 Ppx/GppA family phosphatase [Alphaproteobacteria bacterium]MBU2154171.1 Ppx/GppA family phosphatase [Alphaproteobacteria bacterium]MBU2361563.1 Ppx/GppA family phosphatase [Alphaproteobacteria bacterium]